MGLPGNRDDPYRAGITTVTSGFGFKFLPNFTHPNPDAPRRVLPKLVSAQGFGKLLRGDRGRADHCDNNAGGMIGQHRRLTHGSAG